MMTCNGLVTRFMCTPGVTSTGCGLKLQVFFKKNNNILRSYYCCVSMKSRFRDTFFVHWAVPSFLSHILKGVCVCVCGSPRWDSHGRGRWVKEKAANQKRAAPCFLPPAGEQRSLAVRPRMSGGATQILQSVL